MPVIGNVDLPLVYESSAPVGLSAVPSPVPVALALALAQAIPPYPSGKTERPAVLTSTPLARGPSPDRLGVCDGGRSGCQRALHALNATVAVNANRELTQSARRSIQSLARRFASSFRETLSDFCRRKGNVASGKPWGGPRQLFARFLAHAPTKSLIVYDICATSAIGRDRAGKFAERAREAGSVGRHAIRTRRHAIRTRGASETSGNKTPARRMLRIPEFRVHCCVQRQGKCCCLRSRINQTF